VTLNHLGSLFGFYGAVGCVLVSIGIFSLAIHTHIYRRILAWNALGSGVFLILGAFAKRNAENGNSDPLPQALVITGIVVSVSATALALAIARRIQYLREEDEP
jgi:multicomponent Na+:H+ antiporter subunit C